jgi:hypothetical protein
VFSLASLGLRISYTWPDAWNWIQTNEIFPFGVGLGGIGGAQRFYAQNFFNPSDNFAIFLYANFGILGFVYLGWVCLVSRGLPPYLQSPAVTALAVLTFNFIYGIALSMLEDQVSALFIGAAAGTLWQLRELTLGKRSSDPLGAVIAPWVRLKYLTRARRESPARTS